MAGTLKLDSLQLGDSLSPTQNLTIRSNFNETFTIARGNVGATTQDISTIGSTGGIVFGSDMTVGGAATLNGTTLITGSTNINGTVSIPNLVPINKPHWNGEIVAVTGTDPWLPLSLGQHFATDMVLSGGNKVYPQKAGRYYAKAQILINTVPGAVYLFLRKNGTLFFTGWSGATMQDLSVSGIADMLVGDYFDFSFQGTVTNAWGGPHSNVSIYMV